ncbi:hypothetical protein [Aquipuribacter sp. SD81]|uniref:hypothetical protein n=1 Tax=Aquipuribacter sp. SD81 TaxID=3127703 RepID=UPI0030181E52
MTAPDPGPGPGADALARARDELRRARPDDAEGWTAFAATLQRRLRDVARPGRALRVLEDGPAAAGAGVLRVDERVVADAARRAVAATGARLVGLLLDVTDEVPTRVALQVWAPYGTDVREAADGARAAVARVVEEVLARRCPVDVDVVDVWTDEAS